MSRSVLILSENDDAHATAIADRLEQRYGVRALIWSSATIPAHDCLSYSSEQGAFLKTESAIDNLCDFRCCWWRRPVKPAIPKRVEEERVRRYCEAESSKLLRGAFLASSLRLINDPIRQSAADQKPFQLATARKVGMSVPRTLITNDPSEAEVFVSQGFSTVYKAMASPAWRIVETRAFRESMIDNLASLEFAPVILQELIPKGRDIRIFASSHFTFSYAVRTTAEHADLDWRLDVEANWYPIKIHSDLERKIQRLLQMLGLDYGSLDFRESSDGEFFFFEINPSGQFLFLEQAHSTMLRDAFSELLLSQG